MGSGRVCLQVQAPISAPLDAARAASARAQYRSVLYDTNFFIHLSGRTGARNRNAALHFLSSHSAFPLYTSRICWAELAEGASSPDVVNELLSDYSIIEIDESVAWYTSRAAQLLKGSGRHIGDNDCWIAGTALAKGLPVVTRNTRHFARIARLEVVEY